jgi:hypothetical protein
MTFKTLAPVVVIALPLALNIFLSAKAHMVTLWWISRKVNAHSANNALIIVPRLH